MPPTGSMSNLPASLSAQQLAALQEHIRQQRAQGREVSASTISEWMRANRITIPSATNQSQPPATSTAPAPAQQQYAQAQQSQPADQIINHLFPPQIQSNPQAAVQHLQKILFPASGQAQGNGTQSGTSQSPLLQQVMAIAGSGRLTTDQMSRLKAVVSRNAAQPQQSQSSQAPPASSAPASQSSSGQPAAGNPAATIQSLQQRIAQMETLRKRPDISDEQRQKLDTDIDANRAQLQKYLKLLLAASHQHNPQQQQPQQPQQQQAQQQLSGQNLQHAQQLAMNQRLEAQRQAAAAAAAQQQTSNTNAQYRTASPAFQQQQQQPQQQQARQGTPAGLKQQQPQVKQPLPQQQQQRPGVPPSSAATAKAQPAASSSAYMGLSGATSSSSTLSSMTPAAAEAFPAPRPTLSSGLANSPALSTPAITRPPGFNSALGGGTSTAPGTPGTGIGPSSLLAGSSSSSASAANGGLSGSAVGPNGRPLRDLRPDDSRGRTVQKRKIRELVESIDPNERLSDEVEDLLLELADEFIDSMTRFGCQLAKHRKSDRLEVKDLALHLDKSYGIKIPGFQPEETKAQRRVNLPPGYTGRLAAAKDVARKRANQ